MSTKAINNFFNAVRIKIIKAARKTVSSLVFLKL